MGAKTDQAIGRAKQAVGAVTDDEEQEGAEPLCYRRRPWKAFLFQERALKNPPAYWALNVRKVVLGTQESRLGPVALNDNEKGVTVARGTILTRPLSA